MGSTVDDSYCIDLLFYTSVSSFKWQSWTWIYELRWQVVKKWYSGGATCRSVCGIFASLCILLYPSVPLLILVYPSISLCLLVYPCILVYLNVPVCPCVPCSYPHVSLYPCLSLPVLIPLCVVFYITLYLWVSSAFVCLSCIFMVNFHNFSFRCFPWFCSSVS